MPASHSELDFMFPPIGRLQDTRTQRIREILGQGPTATTYGAAEYCLANHVLEGAEAAARSADAEAFAWYRSHPDAGASNHAITTSAGQRVIVSPPLDQLPRSGISETPYYVLSAATASAVAPLSTLAASAFGIGTRAGFGELLSAHAVVVCLLRERKLGQTLDSWTITRLPGTIFCDYTSDPVVLGRDLVHEAGHNWLNDAIAATGPLTSDDKNFFSPWKGTTRPAYGFLHACWAFPLMMIYCARVLSEGIAGESEPFLSAYLDRQRPLLAAAKGDHEDALSHVGDLALRGRLRATFEQASAL